uniref:Uncharacterized protein n=1 Tax=Arion vulgaris TaxID=1028688 RepID=A0A0B7AH76_9EUPU
MACYLPEYCTEHKFCSSSNNPTNLYLKMQSQSEQHGPDSNQRPLEHLSFMYDSKSHSSS